MPIEYKPIKVPVKEDSKRTDSVGTDDIKKTDAEAELYRLISRFEKTFADAGENQFHRRDAIYEACSILLSQSESVQELFIEHFIDKFEWIGKRDFTSRMTRLRKKKAEDENDNQAVALPEVDRIESYLSDMFELRYNVISNKYEFKNTDRDNIFEEMDVYIILRKLRKKHIDVSANFILEIIKSDFTPRYNPIESYFKKLVKWDGQDHIKKLASYIMLHENDRERFELQFKKMFVRIIAGAFGRAVNKRCMVFVGGQDAGKSTFTRWLIPKPLKDYYTEDCDFSNKDGLISMTGNFIIGLDEIANMPRNDINMVKSIMSKDTIKVRLPYDRRDSLLIRRSSFIASTNDEEFLTDPTGNVRWICFLLQGRGLNWAYKKDIDIDMVWAQAYYLLNSEFFYDLTKEELEENELSNMQFMTKTTEIELIPRFYMAADKNDEGVLFWQATDFYNDLNKRFEGARLNINLSNLGKALRALKFKRESKWDKDTGLSRWGYFIKIHDKALWKKENNVTRYSDSSQMPMNTEFDNK
jgi:hypothetical protein